MQKMKQSAHGKPCADCFCSYLLPVLLSCFWRPFQILVLLNQLE